MYNGNVQQNPLPGMVITYTRQSMDQPGKVVNPACCQLNRENELLFPCPLMCLLRIWSRETGSAVPSRVSLLVLHTQAE